MDISGLSSDYINSMTSQMTTSGKNISSINETDLKNATDDELMSVCKEFEAYFMEQVFKEMKKTVPTNEDMSNSSKQLTDYFEDELVQNYASTATEQGSLGLAQMLYEQMKRNYEV